MATLDTVWGTYFLFIIQKELYIYRIALYPIYAYICKILPNKLHFKLTLSSTGPKPTRNKLIKEKHRKNFNISENYLIYNN